LLIKMTDEKRIPYKVSTSVRFTVPTLIAVDKLAYQRKTSRSDIVEEAVQNYIQEQEAAEEAKKQ
jgi:metal-responsive CopG/Arc/MetJ family transcriptional regulator